MMQFLRKHFKSNSGDSNVSKMTWVALVFVVGAILLVLITSAFRNPINRWFDKVQASWFNHENGEFGLLNQQYMYDMNENGTYKNVRYIHYNEKYNYYMVLTEVDTYENGSTTKRYTYDCYTADWQPKSTGSTGSSHAKIPVIISDDGKTITFVDEKSSTPYTTFAAEIP